VELLWYYNDRCYLYTHTWTLLVLQSCSIGLPGRKRHDSTQCGNRMTKHAIRSIASNIDTGEVSDSETGHRISKPTESYSLVHADPRDVTINRSTYSPTSECVNAGWKRSRKFCAVCSPRAAKQGRAESGRYSMRAFHAAITTKLAFLHQFHDGWKQVKAWHRKRDQED
jgi:hypothetical protein